MRRGTRLRKTAKWVGIVVCITVTAALVYSWRWTAGAYWTAEHPGGLSENWFAIRNGCVEYERTLYVGGGHSPQLRQFTRGPNEGPVVWTPSARLDRHYLDLFLPLWIPFLLFAIPTALLWRRDHVLTTPSEPGRCPQCAYNRRGLVSDAKCPECGTVPAPVAK